MKIMKNIEIIMKIMKWIIIMKIMKEKNNEWK